MSTDLGLTDEEGAILVKFARKAIEEYLLGHGKIYPKERMPEKFSEKRGVFVTLNSVGPSGTHALRGCIGFPFPIMPLIEAVINSAIEAAVGDPRFPPVSYEEMDAIAIELSILTKPQEILERDRRNLPRLIRIGEDGLMIARGRYQGLLLPQVPIEWGWDAEEFLTQCCFKAGLPPDCWLMEGTRIYKFQAEIFCEEKPRGTVIRRRLLP
ncbi:MAG: TIGR00296 family protein [Candidatus Bathyarchaeia archaeon]